MLAAMDVLDAHQADEVGTPLVVVEGELGESADRGERIEVLGWGTQVSTYDHTWRLVREADHPALGVCLDSFHILSRSTAVRACCSSHRPIRRRWVRRLRAV
jgi:hypothetical protein